MALYQRLAAKKRLEPFRRVLAGTASRLIERLPEASVILPYRGGWRIKAQDGSTFVLSKGRTSLYLDRYHALATLKEYGLWRTRYLPPFSLGGLTILDVGAGCGETAALFFEHGASKVIAIESDLRLEKYLVRNAELNHWNLETHMEPFDVKHTKMKFEFAKLDCEGGESVLASRGVRELPPFRVEMHLRPQAARPLISKFHLHYVGGDSVWGSC